MSVIRWASMANGARRGADNDAGRAPEPVELMGVRFQALTQEEVIEHILTRLRQGCGGTAVTANLDHLRRAARESGYRGLMQSADLTIADGMPLVWASRLRGRALPERVAGSSLIEPLAIAAGQRGYRLFLLGGNPGTAEQTACRLQQRCPALDVGGVYCPRPGFERNRAAFARLCEAVVGAQPDLIYVALGSPKQERVIQRLRDQLPRAWWLGVGISFSFLCGEIKRAPAPMQRMGLEWAHRLAQEPKRLTGRYVCQGVPFAARLMGHALSQRVRW